MPLFDKIKSAFANGAANFIEKAGEAIDRVVTNKEEAIKAKTEQEKVFNDFTVQMAEIAFKESELELKEKESARSREIQIANSNASWITKNTTALLALAFVGVTLLLYTLSILGIANIQPELLRDLRDIVILIMGYYFGSSIGSKKKQEQIDKLTK
jgi:hypothetical protein